MKLNQAKFLVNEPRYLEALKVIADAETAEAEAAALLESEVADPVEEPVAEESDLQEFVD